MPDNGRTALLIVSVAIVLEIVLAILSLYGIIPSLDNWAIAIFTTVLVLLAWQTNVLSKNTIDLDTRLAALQKRQIDADTLPDMLVFLARGERATNHIWLVIENCGGGAATNLKFRCEPDFHACRGPLNKNYDIFFRGMSHFPPKHKIAFLLTDFSKEAESKRDIIPTITIDYSDDYGGDHHKEYKIELFQFWGQSYTLLDRPFFC